MNYAKLISEQLLIKKNKIIIFVCSIYGIIRKFAPRNKGFE